MHEDQKNSKMDLTKTWKRGQILKYRTYFIFPYWLDQNHLDNWLEKKYKKIQKKYKPASQHQFKKAHKSYTRDKKKPMAEHLEILMPELKFQKCNYLTSIPKIHLFNRRSRSQIPKFFLAIASREQLNSRLQLFFF